MNPAPAARSRSGTGDGAYRERMTSAPDGGAGPEGSGRTRMGYPWLPTGGLALLTAAVSLVFTLAPSSGRMTPVGALGVSAFAAAAVWLSGSRPAAALVMASAATVAQPLLQIRFAAMDLVVVLVAFQAVAGSALAPPLLAGVTFLTLTVNDWWQRPAGIGPMLEPSLLFPAMLTALTVGLGLQGRRVRQQNVELLRLRESERQRTVSDERRRIARDLHDVAAHHLSAMIVRNRVAQRLATAESLGAAVEFSARTAAETLESLRRVVGTLSTDGEAPRSPTPRLGDLSEVLDRVEAAGLLVERDVEDLGPVDDELGVAVVRIVQESLSNVLRHRGPGRCRVTLRRTGTTVVLTVQDDGRPGEPPAPAPAGTATLAEGQGIVGMRERAAARGGQLEAGRSPHGGWQVRAAFEVRP